MADETVIPPVPPVSAEPPAGMEPGWLKPRLESAKSAATDAATRKILAELGVPDVATAKVVMAEASKVATLQAERDAAAANAEKHASAAKEYAGRMMAGLTEVQSAAVKAIAGEDPSAQIKTIAAMQVTWGKAETATAEAEAAKKAADAAVAAAAAAKAAVPPATTAPATTAPPAGADGGAIDHRARHAALEAKNPFAAAQYAMDNQIYDKPRS